MTDSSAQQPTLAVTLRFGKVSDPSGGHSGYGIPVIYPDDVLTTQLSRMGMDHLSVQKLMHLRTQGLHRQHSAVVVVEYHAYLAAIAASDSAQLSMFLSINDRLTGDYFSSPAMECKRARVLNANKSTRTTLVILELETRTFAVAAKEYLMQQGSLSVRHDPNNQGPRVFDDETVDQYQNYADITGARGVTNHLDTLSDPESGWLYRHLWQYFDSLLYCNAPAYPSAVPFKRYGVGPNIGTLADSIWCMDGYITWFGVINQPFGPGPYFRVQFVKEGVTCSSRLMQWIDEHNSFYKSGGMILGAGGEDGELELSAGADGPNVLYKTAVPSSVVVVVPIECRQYWAAWNANHVIPEQGSSQPQINGPVFEFPREFQYEFTLDELATYDAVCESLSGSQSSIPNNPNRVDTVRSDSWNGGLQMNFAVMVGEDPMDPSWLNDVYDREENRDFARDVAIKYYQRFAAGFCDVVMHGMHNVPPVAGITDIEYWWGGSIETHFYGYPYPDWWSTSQSQASERLLNVEDLYAGPNIGLRRVGTGIIIEALGSHNCLVVTGKITSVQPNPTPSPSGEPGQYLYEAEGLCDTHIKVDLTSAINYEWIDKEPASVNDPCLLVQYLNVNDEQVWGIVVLTERTRVDACPPQPLQTLTDNESAVIWSAHNE